MKQSRLLVVVAVLLATALILAGLNAAFTSTPLNVDGGSSVNVSPAGAVWAKTYGGAGDDRVFYMLPVGTGYLAVGSTHSLSDATEGWVLMLDSGGNTVWNRTYLEGGGTEIRYAVNLTDGFLLVGNTFSAKDGGDVDGYVAKIGFDGGLLWKTVVGSPTIDKLFSGTACGDGYAVFGLTYNGGREVAWAAKLDPRGGIAWSKTYGEGADCAFRSAIYTGDGNFAAAGYIDPSGSANYDFYLTKIGADGTLLWNRTYGGADSEKAFSLTAAQGGYVLAGDAQSSQTSTDAWVVQVDSTGGMVWSRRVGGIQADSAAYITGSGDGAFLVCGFTFSFGAGQRDFWIFKINDGGQVLWSCTYGTAAFEEAYAIAADSGSFVVAGWADPAGQPEMVGKAVYNWCIAKLNTPAEDRLNPPFLVYCAVIFAASAAALVLLNKFHGKTKK